MPTIVGNIYTRDIIEIQMSEFLPPPKKMSWEFQLDQKYSTDRSILVTSGCSFTSSTLQLESAASWPGFVRDRCRFSHCIDYSYPGVGNEYIGDSILHYFSTVKNFNDHMVIVMWSGLDRKEKKLADNVHQPKLGNISYQLISNSHSNVRIIDTKEKSQLAQESANKMFEVSNYLSNLKVPFAFCSYSNLLFPPFIPKRDLTFEFDHKILDKITLRKLQSLPWVPKNPMQYLYEYAFTHDYLNSGDFFHPPVECNLEWTDQILLPAIAAQGLIKCSIE